MLHGLLATRLVTGQKEQKNHAKFVWPVGMLEIAFQESASVRQFNFISGEENEYIGWGQQLGHQLISVGQKDNTTRAQHLIILWAVQGENLQETMSKSIFKVSQASKFRGSIQIRPRGTIQIIQRGCTDAKGVLHIAPRSESNLDMVYCTLRGRVLQQSPVLKMKEKKKGNGSIDE